MIALVNYAKEPDSAELRELPVSEIGEEDVLLKEEAAVIGGIGRTGHWSLHDPSAPVASHLASIEDVHIFGCHMLAYSSMEPA